MKKVALIVAGGVGKRMKKNTPKQFLLLNKMPILMHTIRQFSDFDKIVLVLPLSQTKYWDELCDKYNFLLKHIVVEGGKTRFDSVKNGLMAIDESSIVAIHDGVRPLISKKLINQLIKKVKKGIGVIPVLPVKESIRRIEKNSSANILRDNLFNVQTPQCFLSSDIKNAYQQNFNSNFSDDASVFEKGENCKIISIAGDFKNLKITTKEDLPIVNSFIRSL